MKAKLIEIGGAIQTIEIGEKRRCVYFPVTSLLLVCVPPKQSFCEEVPPIKIRRFFYNYKRSIIEGIDIYEEFLMPPGLNF